MNKIDLLPDDERARVPARRAATCRWCAISARDGATTAPLLEAIEAALASEGFAGGPTPTVDPDTASLPS